MSEGQGSPQRLFDAGKRLLGSILATGETRLRFAVVELEEERARLVTLLLLAGLSMILLLLGLGVLTTLVVVAFWESHRLLAIAVSAGVLLTGGVGLAAWVMHLARRPTLLAGTLKHLALDRELVESRRDAQDTHD
ncbi:phage holin family protein [Halomonas sp. 18H]|uniref:phage holin family protein n=1 Tax=Halomonas almeriensis TaxID=308163 RepID=UPI0022320544|nr:MULTISPECIES: phage holin family protein [Halomonas]MCW4150994.1 phage holin family protein [Halomonas sp. 18H]MDN3552870.1 phage holin family protein [Halomonas almeriensis]